MLSNEARASMTNAGGYFEFTGIPQNDSYKITPQKDNDYLNGVSTLDLVLIQRHILGLQKLNSAYKHVAADVTKDNKINASDLVELRKLILGIYTKFPTNTSWRFLDKSAEIDDIANPWNVNEYIYIDNFNTSILQNNFVAVKVGDVNDSASANAQDNQTEVRNAKVLTLVVQEKTFQTGEYVTLDITAENFREMTGAQWTLNFDASSLEFAGLNAGSLDVSDENLNAGFASEGKLTFSWNDFNGVSVAKGKVLFTLKFKALASGSLSQTVQLSSDITKAEAYNDALAQLNLALTFRGAAADAIFALEQNNPNPFSANTTIGFVLPEAGEARLTVFDVTGKVLKMFTNTYPKGRSEIVLSAEELNAQGVMFYELESNGQKSTRKMIYLSK